MTSPIRPAPITDFEEAMRVLSPLIQADVVPLLTPPEIDSALSTSVRATVWEAATIYRVGDVVIPTDANRTGRRYVCVTSGTSGATEPTWGVGFESRSSDNTASWQEAGAECDLWDIQLAAHKCWVIKTNKASKYADVGFASGDRKSRSQVYEQCRKQAEYYRPVGVA